VIASLGFGAGDGCCGLGSQAWGQPPPQPPRPVRSLAAVRWRGSPAASRDGTSANTRGNVSAPDRPIGQKSRSPPCSTTAGTPGHDRFERFGGGALRELEHGEWPRLARFGAASEAMGPRSRRCWWTPHPRPSRRQDQHDQRSPCWRAGPQPRGRRAVHSRRSCPSRATAMVVLTHAGVTKVMEPR